MSTLLLSKEIAILSGVRTPYLYHPQEVSQIGGLALGAALFREAIYRSEILSHQVDEVLFSQGSFYPSLPYSPHKIASLAGIPQDRTCFSIAHYEPSGLQAAALAIQRLHKENRKVILVASVESYEAYPWLYSPLFHHFLQKKWYGQRAWKRFLHLVNFLFAYLKPFFLIQNYRRQIAQQGELLAKRFGIRREEQDRYVQRSHRLAIQSLEQNKEWSEIMPLHLPPDYESFVEKDALPQENLSLEELAKKAPLLEEGTLTDQHIAHFCENGSALVLAHKSFVEEKGLSPLGYIRGFEFSGCKKKSNSLASILAAYKLLKKAKLNMSDMDLINIHEGSSTLVLACEKLMNSPSHLQNYLGISEAFGPLDMEKVNVSGGALAYGCAMGTVGIHLVLSLLRELIHRKLRYGLVLVSSNHCEGGAMIIENATLP